jgi:T5SS/PEP-CTERM-associated repeat protein
MFNTKTYTGHGSSGNFADAANWSGSGGIDANSIATVGMDATVGGTVTVAQLMLLGREAVTLNGTLNALWQGPCRGFMVCDNAVATFAPTAVLNDAGGFVVGVDSTGTLIAQGHGATHSTLNSGAAKIGQFAGSHGFVTIDGAVWNDAHGMLVGQYGSGTLTISDGGHVNEASNLVVGVQSGASGQINVGAGSSLSVAADARIGMLDTVTGPASSAAVTVAAGGTFAVGTYLRVVGGGALILAGGAVTVGDMQTGMQVLAGGTVTGYGAMTSAGAFWVDGSVQASGGTLVLNGDLRGHGSLQIEAGATAQVNAAIIGDIGLKFAGADATLVLNHGFTGHANISGFGLTDAIQMTGIDHLDWNAAAGVLTLSDAGQVVDRLHVAGTYAGGFDLTQTSAGAMITVHVTSH